MSDLFKQLSKQEMGEIALALAIHDLREHGVEHFKPNETVRTIGNKAKNAGISADRLTAYYRQLGYYLVDTSLGLWTEKLSD